MDRNNDDDDDREMESDEFDEKRNYTPQPQRRNQLAKDEHSSSGLVGAQKFNHSMIGLRGGGVAGGLKDKKGENMNKSVNSGVNLVYTYKKTELIAPGPKTSSKNSFVQIESLKQLLDNKGSKCKCSAQD